MAAEASAAGGAAGRREATPGEVGAPARRPGRGGGQVSAGVLAGEGLRAVAREPAGRRGRERRERGNKAAGAGAARGELPCGVGPAARRARWEPAAAGGRGAARGDLGGGGEGAAAAAPAPPARGGAAGPIVSRQTGVRRWGALGGQRRRRLRWLHAGAATAATSPPPAAAARQSHKRQRSSPARGPAHAAAERSPAHGLSFPSSSDREAGPTRAAGPLGEPAGGRAEMPLLHRKPFVRQKPPADLRPDEEVFYCKVTNEIFRHYE